MDTAFPDLVSVRRRGRRGLLATVVRGFGSTYRRPGSSAVVVEGGEVLGAISGGCMESDVLVAASDVFLGTAPARLLEYDTAGEEDLIWGTGSGCGGRVQVLVAPVADEVLEFVAARLEAGRTVVVATGLGSRPGRRTAFGLPEGVGDVSSAEADLDRAGTLEVPELDQAAARAAIRLLTAEEAGPLWAKAGGEEVFLQRVEPLPQLLICGAGDDARPVARLARQIGFRVVVADHRPAWATPDRFPTADAVVVAEPEELAGKVAIPDGSYAVLMTHHYFKDLELLRQLLPRPLRYIGLLGARERSRRLIRQIGEEAPELLEHARSRLRAPVGLDLGADGPEEIAVSILGEILAVRGGRAAVPLTQTRGPLLEPVASD